MNGTLTGFVIGAILAVCGKDIAAGGTSKVDVARLTVKTYAYEAYPEWAAAHPAKDCPDKLEDLNEYMHGDTREPWGHRYKMMCGATLPAGAKGIAIISPGPDGKVGTADDVKSWE